MYSTKNIEKILIASRKPLLARKIKYLNEPTKDTTIVVYIENNIPDIIFIYYADNNEINIIDNFEDKLYFFKKSALNNYQKPASNSERLPFEEKVRSTAFLFFIEQQNKTIKNKTFNTNIGTIPTFYSNEDVKKILKDLIKNNIITDDYKVIDSNGTYLVKNILSNKNQSLKYSKNGNPLMYHGTSWQKWEQIKKTGGLKPRVRTESDDFWGTNETFLESLVYLSASFSIAKFYASKTDNPVILLVEVPDKDKLFIDTGYLEKFAQNLIMQIADKDFVTNNKDIRAFRQHLEWKNNETFPYFKDITSIVNIIRFDYALINLQTLMKAVIDEDFSIIERYLMSYDKFRRLNETDLKTFLNQIHELYNIFVKYYKNKISSPRALRLSMNNTNLTKNAVAYHGRIPLSYIRGVFDINGQRIE